MNEPDWLGPAQDCLRERTLDEAADLLALGWQAIRLLESLAAHSLRAQVSSEDTTGAIALIAQARGETPEQALARLSPPTFEAPDTLGDTLRQMNRLRHTRLPPPPAGSGFYLDGPNTITYRDGHTEVWGNPRPTPLADIQALREMVRTRYGVPEEAHRSPPIMASDFGRSDDPSPPAASPLKPGLADYLKAKLAGGRSAPAKSRRRLP